MNMIETYEARIEATERDKKDLNKLKEETRNKVNDAKLEAQKAKQDKENLERTLDTINN